MKTTARLVVAMLATLAVGATVAASAPSPPDVSTSTHIFGSPDSLSSEQTQAAIENVRRALAATTSLTADFVQTDHQGQSLRGKLTLKRPGKVRFQYSKDVPLLIVGDGASLTMIDYEVRQVQRWPIKNSPLMALLDPQRDFAGYAKIIPMGDPKAIAIALHDPDYPEFGTMTMLFLRDSQAPGGWRLRGWITEDTQNYRTRIDLANHQYNVTIANSTFRWRDPRPRKRLR